MIIKTDNESQIVKNRDNALKNCISQINYRHKFKLQKKLELLPLGSKKRDEITRKMERQKQSLIEQKTKQYQKRCDNDIVNIDNVIIKPKKSKAKTNNGQLNKLLVLLQKYVRLRDSDHMGYGRCISCGKKIHRKEANGGHYYERSYKSVCTQLTNINLQCQECNAMQSNGDQKQKMKIKIDHRIGLIQKYGQDAVDVLDQLVLQEKSDPVRYGKISIYDIDEWISVYSPIVVKMEKEKLLPTYLPLKPQNNG